MIDLFYQAQTIRTAQWWIWNNRSGHQIILFFSWQTI